jgi:hypothetical protein
MSMGENRIDGKSQMLYIMSLKEEVMEMTDDALSFDMDELMSRAERFFASGEAKEIFNTTMIAAEEVTQRLTLDSTIDVATLHTRMSI